MALKTIAASAALNGLAAATGILATALIVWHFGLDAFGEYIVGLAKLSVILLGMELVPGSFTQFRLQDDGKFARCMPVFYLLFGAGAAGMCAGIIAAGAIEGASWFMLLYVFCAVMQRCLDSQMLARGAVSQSVSVPLIANVLRVVLLVASTLLPSPYTTDALWGSLACGMLASQIVLLIHSPEIARGFVASPPLPAVRYLWSLRAEYRGYYANSVLKRVKDTLFPLLCNMAIPSKAVLGQILVYTRTWEAVAIQVRVVELALIHRGTRSSMARNRRHILLWAAALGHLAVVVIATMLLWRHDLTLTSLLYAVGMGLAMYPYAYELAKRSDAYAALQPARVTQSLLVYIAVLTGSLGALWLTNLFVTPALIASIVLAQMLSSSTYLLQAKAARLTNR